MPVTKDVSGAREPKYLQIARGLKKEIVDGVYPAGSQLPTEEALCERYSVSRYTVREALRRLREDNLVTSKPRAGTIVVSRPSTTSYAQDVMTIEQLLSWSEDKRFEIESIEMVVVDEKLAAWTGLKLGDHWLAVRGWGHTEGQETPYCWAEYFIHRDFAGVGRMLRRHTGPIFPLIEDLFGQTVVEVHQEVEATLITPMLAAGLKVQSASAALRIRRLYTTSEGKLAQVTFSTHPAASYRYSDTLRRIR